MQVSVQTLGLTLALSFSADGSRLPHEDPLTCVERIPAARALLHRAATFSVLHPARVRLSERSGGALLLEDPTRGDAWLSVLPLDVEDVAATKADRSLVYAAISADVDAVSFALPRGAEELRVVRSPRAATRFRYELALAAGASLPPALTNRPPGLPW